jgi:retron-type reverse transcriptase
VLRDEVISTDSLDKPGTALAAPAHRRATVHVADVTLPLSLVLWALGVTRTNASELGSFGLTADLSIFFYAGVALLIVSAVIELATESPSRWRMALHAVGLVVMLYGTAPLIYPEGRYSWLYKTIGVVQYVNVHGQLNHNIDIYQNWPGFFALAGWFSKVAGAGNPVTYAKWAQLVFELAALPLLYLAYDALSLTVRQRWLALLLYSGSNWIGQDYYSPQALGTILSLGIMAIAMRWLFMGNYGQFRRKPSRVTHRKEPEKQAEISRQEVLEAFYSVRSQQGPPGVDGITIADFGQDLAHNLQKIWVQMCSGAYFPPPARSVEVTRNGRVRSLSVSTVGDRVAQTVVARRLEARLTQVTGAREVGHAGQAARSAAGSWSVELNLRTVFANCRHDLLLRALEATSDQRWIVQYVRRYLRVPEQQPDGSLKPRSRGLAADSPLAPVLADLFLCHVLDIWMDRNFPGVKFERQRTIVAVQCGSEQEAGSVSASIVRRFSEVGLTIRPQRIRIVHRQPGRPDRYVAPGPDLALTTVLSLPRSALAADPPRDEHVPGPAPARSRQQAAFCATILLLFFVLSFTHELSPYIIIVQLGLLAGGRMLRPRWLPVALLAVAIGYLLPRLSFVSSHYGLLDSIGSFFSNVAPPSASVSSTFLPVPRDQILIQRCAEGLSVIIWLLALAGAWRRRRSGRTMLALVALTFSPVLVLAAQAYGNEGVLRVYLFSLPWAAALAASAIEPVTGLGGRALSRLGAVSRRQRLARSRSVLSWLRVPVVLGVVLGLFFVAFFGDDAFDVMPQTEVNTLLAFQQHARLGPVYCATGNAALLDTAKYNRFQLITIFGSLDGAPVVNQATPDIANVLARNSTIYTDGRQPAYVVVTPSMIAYSKTYNEVPAQSFTILLASLAHSSKWKLIVNNGHGTIIYELPPGAA